jgi:hypothetical protein
MKNLRLATTVLALIGMVGISFAEPTIQEKTMIDKPQPRILQPDRPYILSPQTTGYLLEDVWPTIFFGEDAVDEIRRKAANLPWAAEAVAIMKEEADRIILQPPQLPVEKAGWRHDFFSRVTGEHLVYEAAAPDSYLDPATGNREADAAQRRAWVLLTHERTYRIMRGIGILYRLTGDERYAQWVAQGMRQAAAYHQHHEFHHPSMIGPALYYHNLYDAAMLMLLANDYSLTRHSAAYSPEDHRRIREQIFDDRMPTMIGFLKKYPKHNMTCFVAGALAFAGQLFDKPDWVQLAFGENSGLQTLLLTGMLTDANGTIDGLWFEGTMFYHFYSLCPLVSLWELERHRGGKLVQDPDLIRRFSEMFAAPVTLVDEQLRLPLVGDLGAPRVMNLAAYRHLYEYAAGQVDPQRFGPILAAIYAQSGAPRQDLTALAYGPDTLPEPAGIPQTSTLLPVTKIGVFRTPAPSSLYFTFRSGKYIGGHDHPDRLTIALNAFGEVLSPDLGEPGYSLRGSQNLSYFRTTAAHNTLFADDLEQTGEASLIWRPDVTPACARGSITDARGIRYRRSIFVEPSYVVLLDDYMAETEHCYDWIYHAYGTLKVDNLALSETGEPALGMPPLAETRGYSFLSKRCSGTVTNVLDATWQVSPLTRLHLLSTSDAPFEVNTAVAPGNPYPDTQGVVLLRAPGKTRRFATVLEPSQGKTTVAGIALKGEVITLTLTNGEHRSYQWQP